VLVKEGQRTGSTHKLESAEGVANQNTERKSVNRGTHFLEGVEGRPCQYAERKGAIQGHSQTVENRGRDKSAQREKVIEGRPLTI
jgi:hypothetical protein